MVSCCCRMQILPIPCTEGMLPWQPFLALYIWGAHWRHLANTTEPSMFGGDAALCQITLTTCCCCCWQLTDVGRVVINVTPMPFATIQPRRIGADVKKVSMATERSVSVSAVSMAISIFIKSPDYSYSHCRVPLQPRLALRAHHVSSQS